MPVAGARRRATSKSRPPSSVSLVTNLVLSFGVLLALAGAGKYFLNSTVSLAQPPTFASSMTERRLAIITALNINNDGYNFTTNFIPGIGQIPKPEAYLKKVLNNPAITTP